MRTLMIDAASWSGVYIVAGNSAWVYENIKCQWKSSEEDLAW